MTENNAALHPQLVNNPLLEQLRGIDKRQTVRRLPQEAALGAAVVLLEIAASDSKVTTHEVNIVRNGISALFGATEQEATALMAQASSTLQGLRGSTSYAEMLKSYLDPSMKEGMAQLMDSVINSDGKVDGFEIYLRNRFRLVLGISEQG